jgi:hypothetical protein
MLEALARGAFDREVGRLDKRLLQWRGWTVITDKFPVLDVVFGHATRPPLRLRFTCDGWDDQPPSIELLDEAGAHLPTPCPAGHPHHYVFANSGSVFNTGPHSATTARPFVCMRGSREYHTHDGHRTDSWDNYRGKSGNDLLGLVDQLWKVWKRAAQ